jgi:ABC-2 type transport system ATP-binding protein
VKTATDMLPDDLEFRVAACDRIAIIDRGKLLLVDTPDDLKKTMGKGDIIELQLEDRAINGTILQRVSALDGIAT